VQYQATLDIALAQAGIANFPIETTQLLFLTDTEMDEAAHGLIRVAAHLRIIHASNESHFSVPPAFIRQEVTADNAGLWEPNRALMQEIGMGDEIGTLRKLPDFQQQKIRSPSQGVLVQYRHRQLVSTGTSLFSIGHNADEIIVPYL
jgi:predicted deacylase